MRYFILKILTTSVAVMALMSAAHAQGVLTVDPKSISETTKNGQTLVQQLQTMQKMFAQAQKMQATLGRVGSLVNAVQSGNLGALSNAGGVFTGAWDQLDRATGGSLNKGIGDAVSGGSGMTGLGGISGTVGAGQDMGKTGSQIYKEGMKTYNSGSKLLAGTGLSAPSLRGIDALSYGSRIASLVPVNLFNKIDNSMVDNNKNVKIENVNQASAVVEATMYSDKPADAMTQEDRDELQRSREAQVVAANLDAAATAAVVREGLQDAPAEIAGLQNGLAKSDALRPDVANTTMASIAELKALKNIEIMMATDNVARSMEQIQNTAPDALRTARLNSPRAEYWAKVYDEREKKYLALEQERQKELKKKVASAKQ